MTVDIDNIVADVALLLGESLSLECEPEESPFPGFSRRVELLIPVTLATILQETPKEKLTGWKKLPENISIDSEGVATLLLPDDLLIFGKIRTSGWKRDVTEITAAGSPHYCRQASPWSAISGSADRPVAYAGISAGGRPCLYLYRCSPGDSLLEGEYLPYPAVSDGRIEVPRNLYDLLILRLGDEIRKYLLNPSS